MIYRNTPFLVVVDIYGFRQHDFSFNVFQFLYSQLLLRVSYDGTIYSFGHENKPKELTGLELTVSFSNST